MNKRSEILSAGQTLIGQKGFNAVGLAEILKSAGVPKGSFYHFFASKDAYGVAMLDSYFESYHAEMDQVFAKPGLTAAERLMLYFANWRENQTLNGCEGRCLAVKLGAEVSDFSEPMRAALNAGTKGIVARLTAAIDAGNADGSLKAMGECRALALNLYSLWVGASVMVKISRTEDPFVFALAQTRKTLGMGA